MRRRRIIGIVVGVFLAPVLLWLAWMAYWGRLGLAAVELLDASFLSYYGQVVDENGIPQTGVEVRYFVDRSRPLKWLVPGVKGHRDEITRVTDDAGRFEVCDEYGLRAAPYAFRKGDKCWVQGVAGSSPTGNTPIGTPRNLSMPLPTRRAPYRIVIRLDRGLPVAKLPYLYPDAFRSDRTSKQTEAAVRHVLPATIPVPAAPDIWARLLDGTPQTRPVENKGKGE